MSLAMFLLGLNRMKAANIRQS